MNKYLFICCLLALYYQNTKAQNEMITAPSPVSAEFAKYINFEVALYHGIPEISVPLYTIKLKGGLTIPINLSYYASGIKFWQDSGDVGLGWVLNPGYRISRYINGYADELHKMPTNSRKGWSDLMIGSRFTNDKFLSQFVADDQFTNVSGEFDGEFDQFTFSLPNAGGGFIITDRENHTVTLNEASPLNFKYLVGNSNGCFNGTTLYGIKGFEMTDEKGIKYFYGNYLSDLCANEFMGSYGRYGGLAPTAWGLTDIITPVGDQVKFKYEQRLNETNSCSRSLVVSEAHSTFGYVLSDVAKSENCNDHHATFFPSEIITPNEKVIFTRISQSDNRISNIQIFSFNNQLYKKINFHYKNGYLSSGGLIRFNYNLLDYVTITDNNNIAVETFKFDYYPCPDYQYAPDELGYIMVGNPEKYLHEGFRNDLFYLLFSTHSYPFQNPEVPLWNMSGVGEVFSSRRDDFNVPNFLSLRKITYPTGGYTEYEYEKNNYTDGYSGLLQKAGMRVSRISSFDLQGSESLVRRYKYGVDECGYGIANFMVNKELFVSENPFMDFQVYDGDRANLVQRRTTYSSDMQGEAGIVACQPGFVKYPCVTEYYSSSTLGNSKTEYFYNVGAPYDTGPLYVTNRFPRGVYQTYPRYILTYRPWDRPYLYKKMTYDQNDSALVKEDYYYDQASTNSYIGLKTRIFASTSDMPITDYSQTIDHSSYYASRDGYDLPSFFNYGLYTYEVGKSELTRKRVTEYRHGQAIVADYSYKYSNMLLSKETVLQSTGDTLTNYTTYPLDYAVGETFIDSMVSNRLIAYPIEKVSYLSKGVSHGIISGFITKYKTGRSGLPENQWRLETSSPISLNSFSFSNLPTVETKPSFSINNHYVCEASFEGYDSKGNLTKILSKDGVYTYYLWAYNNQYPVAKITTNINTSIQVAVNDANLSYSNNLQDVEKDISYLKNLLQGYFNSNDYQVGIYTYRPLVGMTSATAPNGVTTYYDYDAFNRLKRTYIKENKVEKTIQTYDYHYQGQ